MFRGGTQPERGRAPTCAIGTLFTPVFSHEQFPLYSALARHDQESRSYRDADPKPETADESRPVDLLRKVVFPGLYSARLPLSAELGCAGHAFWKTVLEAECFDAEMIDEACALALPHVELSRFLE
jgi:hypothetical protein